MNVEALGSSVMTSQRFQHAWKSTMTELGATIVHCSPSVVSCNPQWEAAFQRFETPEEEVQKFVRRLRYLGVARLPKTCRAVEICCGRGNGLVALERLGFECREGVDLSLPLLSNYAGQPIKLYLADCRNLPFDDQSKDLVIVQGGLHHLPDLPEDVLRTVNEVQRVLKRGGRFVVVEPYPTRTLAAIHRIASLPAVRRMSPRLDALTEMTELEQETYDRWLGQAESIRRRIAACFVPFIDRVTWTKWMFVGQVVDDDQGVRETVA